jgi:putative DNA primase/helicase
MRYDTVQPEQCRAGTQFPASLKALKIWCLWRYKDRDGKRTKVPFQVNGIRARSNDPSTWACFADACAAASDELQLGLFADGSHTFVDLDGCIAVDGTIEPWAQANVSSRTKLRCVQSYAELSPSGFGFIFSSRGQCLRQQRSMAAKFTARQGSSRSRDGTSPRLLSK